VTVPRERSVSRNQPFKSLGSDHENVISRAFHRSGRRGSNPRHLAREAVPRVTTLEDERLLSPTAMRVCGTRQSVDPHGYVLTFRDVVA
jgi:hypothetical protein